MTRLARLKEIFSKTYDVVRIHTGKVWFVLISIPSVLLMVSLILSILSQWVNPSIAMFLSYFGLGFPVIVILSVLWIIVLLILGEYSALWFMVPLVFAIPLIRLTFPIGFSFFSNNDIKDDCDTVRILTYNVKDFGLTPTSLDNIMSMIDSVKADIVCMQEFSYTTIKNNKDGECLLNELMEIYPYQSKRKVRDEKVHDVLTFSRYPIREVKVVSKKLGNKAIYTSLDVNGDTLNIVNCHLSSNRLTREDKELIMDLKNAKDTTTNKGKAIRYLSKRFIDSYTDREVMANDVSDFVKELASTPLIICGDFNDVPVSYTYHTVRGKDFEDINESVGFGYNYTFREKPFWVRIDHILYSKSVFPISFDILKVEYSDHFPTTAQFVFRKKQKVEDKKKAKEQ